MPLGILAHLCRATDLAAQYVVTSEQVSQWALHKLPRFQQTSTKAVLLLQMKAMVLLRNGPMLPSLPCFQQTLDPEVQVLRSLPSSQQTLNSDVQALRSLPCFQQTSAKALKLLEIEVQSGLTHLTVTNHAEQNTSWQRLTVNFLLLLGQMADNYQLEREAFLQKLEMSHGVEGENESGAVVHSPESPQSNKRHRSGVVVLFWACCIQLYDLLNKDLTPPAPPGP